MAPLGPAQERQAVSKTGYTLEQLVEAAEAYPTLVHRHLEASGECAAAVDNLRKMRSLGDVRNPLPDGTSRPWPVATHAAEREVLAQRELSSVLEAFTNCSEMLEAGAVQHALAVDTGSLTELRLVTTPTRELVERALIAADQIRIHAIAAPEQTRRVADELENQPGQAAADAQPASRFERAYRSFESACREAESELTCRQAYEWLQDAGSDDYLLPSFETWSRYVREGKKHYGTQTNSPRAGRRGRSVVSAEQL